MRQGPHAGVVAPHTVRGYDLDVDAIGPHGIDDANGEWLRVLRKVYLINVG